MARLYQRVPASDGMLVSEVVEGLPPQSVSTDDAFNVSSQRELNKFDIWSMGELKERDMVYSSLLTSYKEYTEITLDKNPKRQVWFFWAALAILVASPIQFFICLWSCFRYLQTAEATTIEASAQVIAALLASGAETFGALMFLPKIIAEYLFNTNETTSINSIVSAIQNYDIAIRSGIRHTAEGDHSTTTKT